MDENGADRNAPRPPTRADLVELCRKLNQQGARYCVLGGMAMTHYGLVRPTKDIDLLVDPGEENIQNVRQALLYLPDGAAREIEATDVQRYVVVRVADELVVDLMGAACGLSYADLVTRIEPADYDGVRIPFLAPDALFDTKNTVRPQDAADRLFLAEVIASRRR